ncbi:hypothetical protein NECAME_12134 [Necator americanus]|uniref:Uncharacterized protein n=1 Tax=Necator americanus TaxID=51031 RepID=W2T4B8_NECAM|nr:hypothetical protein NECAME_12134 [Necator americanus]ETN75792.1 hypothetical protein NECAME_12134 [Necator americanus]
MQSLARIRILEPEDPSTVSASERRVRRLLSLAYRLSVSVFVTAHLFDFLFSSVWMHGYIWSLNLPIDLDMSDKSAGAIVYHQLEQVSSTGSALQRTGFLVGSKERVLLMSAKVLAITLLLVFSGFASGKPQTVWRLFRLSACVGVLCAFVRALQLKQRLFSSLHEGFYCYFITFIIGLILTLKPLERLPKTAKKETTKEINEQTSSGDFVEENNNNIVPDTIERKQIE